MNESSKLKLVITFLIGVIIGGAAYFFMDQLTPVQIDSELIQSGTLKLPRVTTTLPKAKTNITLPVNTRVIDDPDVN